MIARIVERGRWRPDQVQVRRFAAQWTPPTPELAAAIDRVWQDAIRRGGRQLFDGAMMRLDEISAAGGTIRFDLSNVSYKPFFAMQLSRQLDDWRSKLDAWPDPLGVSVVLEEAGGRLLFGRRGPGVAYHPHRVHPFAGSMTPEDATPFETALRELEEELHVDADSVGGVGGMTLLGVVEDEEIGQPEAVIYARTTRTLGELRRTLDPAEHEAIVALSRDELQRFTAGEEPTPVCKRALELLA